MCTFALVLERHNSEEGEREREREREREILHKRSDCEVHFILDVSHLNVKRHAVSLGTTKLSSLFIFYSEYVCFHPH